MAGPEAIARAALAVIAIVLVGWFAVLARNDRAWEAAERRILTDPNMSQADWTRTMDELERAEKLRPGTDRKVVRAAYLFVRDKPAALRVAESVVREEPENLDGWGLVLRSTSGSDPSRAARAAREIRRLAPLEQR